MILIYEKFSLKINNYGQKNKVFSHNIYKWKKFYIGDNEKFTLTNEIEKKKSSNSFAKFSIKEFFEFTGYFIKRKIDLNNVEKYFYHMSRRWDLQKKNDQWFNNVAIEKISDSLKLYNKLKNENKLALQKLLI